MAKVPSRVRRRTNQSDYTVENAPSDVNSDCDDAPDNCVIDNTKNTEDESDGDDGQDVSNEADADDEDDAGIDEVATDGEDLGNARGGYADADGDGDGDGDVMLQDDSTDKQGASRTTGGVSRGHAAGNVLNIADTFAKSSVEDPPFVTSGRVLVFENKTDAEPAFTMKHIITSDLRPILARLADLHAPIRSESIFSWGLSSH